MSGALDKRSAEVMHLQQMMIAVAAGDRAAFSILYTKTYAGVRAVAQNLLRSPEDAEEVAFDVFIHVWRAASTYDADRGSVGAWLTVMTRNKCIDILRCRRQQISLDDIRHVVLVETLTVDWLGPDDLFVQNQASDSVRRALATLSPLRRRILDLAFYQGMTHRELADAVGMPLGTVKSHLRRGLASLRAHVLDLSP